MKRLSILIAAILTASMLASCSSGNAASTDSSATVSETSSTVSTGSGSSSEADPGEGPSWKIDTSPVTLEYFVGYDWASFTFSPETNEYDKYLLDETGVTINWTYGNQEKLNMLITTDSLPDIVTYDIMSNERLTMENNQLLLPLEELMEQYAPDFNVVPSMVDWYRNPDGHWYAFASFFYSQERCSPEFGGYYVSHNKNYARKDLMEELGIKETDFSTKEDVIRTLVKVKDSDLTYNGLKVEPMVGLADAYLAEQFGMDREDSDGNLVNEYRTDEYKEALMFYNELYRNGLISDEEFTMDNTLREQKVVNGTIFYSQGSTNLAGDNELEINDADAIYYDVGYVKGNNGDKQPYITPSPTGGWTGTMISKNCQSPERAIRLFAFLSQEEETLYNAYGGYGRFNITDGKVEYIPEMEDLRNEDLTSFENKFGADPPRFMVDWTFFQKYAPDLTKENEIRNRQRDQEVYSPICFTDMIFSNVIPDAGTELATLNISIDAYWKQQRPLIIMAGSEEEASSLYDQTIAQMDAMGMEQVDEYKNSKFKENKEKLDLEFAWPRNQ